MAERCHRYYNPDNGKVEGILDMSGLRKSKNQTTDTEVLNGIALQPKTKTIFVTGKTGINCLK
jgi:glutamine cyclotransferase